MMLKSSESRQVGTMEKEWFRDWFSSDEYLGVYSHRNNQDAKKFLELILERTNLSQDARILDAACGAGRHTIYLASKGFRVTGFDLSKTLLMKAKAGLNEKSLYADLFCADLRNVCLRPRFDLILNLFTSFGYFKSDEENFRFVKIAYNLLNENGVYILDYLNMNYLSENLIHKTIKVIGHKKITEQRKIEEGRVVKEILIENGEIKNSFFESVQLYSKEKIVNEFEKIGFSVKELFGDYTGLPFDENKSPRLILFFKK